VKRQTGVLAWGRELLEAPDTKHSTSTSPGPRSRLLHREPVRTLDYGLLGLCIFAIFVCLPGGAAATTGPAKLLRRLVAPFRSHPFLQTSAGPCSIGFAHCFVSPESTQPTNAEFDPREQAVEDPSRTVTMQLRSLRRGPFCHHWLEVETRHGLVTIGFGPATVPFIDAGQISLQDAHGNIERISGMHPIPLLGLPPANYHYAKPPGAGRPLGPPVRLTLAQADAVIERQRRRKFVSPYIPIFSDCRTFTCSVAAGARGRSSLPCYLLFKGYW
jgi:hypothetical protein